MPTAHTAKLHVVSPEQVADTIRSGPLNEALVEISRLAGAELTVDGAAHGDSAAIATLPQAAEIPVRYRDQSQGRVIYHGDTDATPVARAAHAVTSLLEHVVDREMAVGDLAEEMIACYEELNMLYAMLPDIATRVHASDIGEALVAETGRTLRCRRVSLLVLDDTRKSLKVLASRGLPDHARNISIPLTGTIAGRALTMDDCLIVNDLSLRPDLLDLSRGDYDSDAFAVVRVPLQAQGEAVGVLTATERIESPEFTARDRKLLEGLSAMGASALLNCRLHGAINRQMVSTIRALASAIDAKDQYTHDHSARVAHLCLATARELGMNDAETFREVELAGLLHDIGKIGIPDAILTKTGRLTPQEFSTVQRHAGIGARIVEHVEGLEHVAQAIRHHHERYDGLGYPAGLVRDAIPFTSRLISVADVYDCLTSDRPYRKAVDHEQAIGVVNKAKGTQLHPAVVEAFVRVIAEEMNPTPREHDAQH